MNQALKHRISGGRGDQGGIRADVNGESFVKIKEKKIGGGRGGGGGGSGGGVGGGG